MQQRPGARDVGIEYQFKVVTYVAASLSQKENVRNFVIHSNLENIPGFDDLVIKVWFEEEEHPYVYLGQVKHRSSKINFDSEKHKLRHYKEYMEAILNAREQIAFITDVPVDNIEFWYFSNNFISGNITLERQTPNSGNCLYGVIPHLKYKSILPSDKNVNCYRLKTKDSNEKDLIFDKFHFFLNQPNNWQIENKIRELCHEGFTKKMTEDIIKYVDKYFNRFKADGLTKVIFDTEVLKIHLSKFTMKPTKIIEININQARIWNELTLNHYITIIEDVKNIEAYLHGCFVQAINDMYGFSFKWNDCMTDGGKLGENFDIQKFVDLSKSKQVRHWLLTPDTVEFLLIEMWKWDDLPLILKPTNGISILSKYKHLKKRFIIIGDVEAKYKEANLFCPNVFSNVANIRSVGMRNQLLNGLMVSLQGRIPVRLYDIISDNVDIMEDITCAKILHLIKKRRVYLQERCLTETELTIYLITGDVEKEDNINLGGFKICDSNNILIKCKRFSTFNLYYNQIKSLNKFQNYSIYHLLLRNNKLEILRGNKFKIRNYLIDQDGNNVYGLGKYSSVSIIGNRLGNKEQIYIQRDLCLPIVNWGIVNIQEQRICFLCGDVQNVDDYLKKQIVTEFSEFLIKNNAELGRNTLFHIKNAAVEKHWINLVSSPHKYQLFHVRVKKFYLELLKYNNCPNISQHIYTPKRIPEHKFFREYFRFTKIVVISAATGMGKSLLIQSLSEICSKKDYVIFFNLAYCREDLQNSTGELLETPLDFIFKKAEKSQPFMNLLDKIRNFHQTNGRLVLFLDSFDEVAQFYADKVLHLIENIAKLNIRLIISSKSTHANMLSERFQIVPITIGGLDQTDIKKYTKSKNSSDIDLKSIPLGMAENPLYLNLLCYLHQNGSLKVCTDTFYLYEQIWDMKIKRYFNKNKLDYNLKIVKDNLLKNHRLMALVAVFGKDVIISKVIEDYEKFVDQFKSFDVNLGLVELIKDDIPIFVHQVIAIVLATEWVCENLLIDVTAQDIYKMIVQGNEFTDIRYSFDSLICKDLELHYAVIKEDMHLVKQLCTKSNLKKIDKCGRTVLHLAISYCKDYSNRNNFMIVEVIIKTMLENKCDINKRDAFLKWRWIDYVNFYNKTFFYFACVHGSTATVDLYLHEKQDDDLSVLKRWRNSTRHTIFDQIKVVLQEVLINNHADICRMLLKKVTSLSHKDIFDSTAIHLATKAGHLDIVCLLLKKGANINGKDELVNTPLHYAVRYQHESIVRYLLENGADIKAMNANGNIPLHEVAGSVPFADWMEILFVNKAMVNKKNNDGMTILHYVCRQGNLKNVRFVLDHGGDVQKQSLAGLSPLHFACTYNGNVDVISELIKRRANIQSTDVYGKTPLHRAAEAGFVGVVKLLLQNKAEIHVIDLYGQTPFHLSCTRLNIDVVNLLLNHGVDISARNEDGETSLHISIHHKTTLISSLLIKKGIDLTATDNCGLTALHIASEKGITEIVQELLDAQADANQQDIFGNTPLHLASLKGHESVCKLLVKSNKNILSTINNYGKTPLHLACEEGHCNLVKYLVTNGVEILAVDNYGKTPLHSSSEFGRLEILKMLIDGMSSKKNYLQLRDNFGRTLLHLASLRGRIEVAQYLLDKGVNPDVFDKKNSTPLHLSCSSGHRGMLNLLLRNNADIMVVNKDNKTPLHIASQEGYVDIVDVLFPKYTNHILLDSLGKTCLHLAAEYGHKDVVKILIQNKTLVLIKSFDQQTPLHLAVKNGHSDIVRILLTSNAQITIKDLHGNTPFNIAVYAGHLEIVKIFLKRGIDVNEFNNLGETSLHMAIKKCHLPVIKLLLRSGASLQLKDETGNTPLHLGVLQNNLEIVDVLMLHGADTTALNNDEETAVDVAKRLKLTNIFKRMEPVKKKKPLFSRIRKFLS